MRTNETLSNFRNVREYILLLPIQEQVEELNKVIKYHTNYHQPRVESNSKYSIINQFKDFKESLIRYHLQKVVENPSLRKCTPPLHELLGK